MSSCSGTGHSLTAGEGEVELVFDEACVMRDGLMSRIKLFDPTDEAVGWVRYEELRA